MSASGSPQAAPGRRFRRSFLILLMLLCLLPLLLVAALLLLLRSEAGTAWLLEQVPGLEVRAGQGSLLGPWQAQEVRWQGYGVILKLQQPHLDWSPSCLLQKRLCIDALEVTEIRMQTAPGADGDAADGPRSLPQPDIPLAWRIEGVRLGSFRLNGRQIWDELEVEVHGSGAAWEFDRVRYRSGDVMVQTHGRVETRGNWPLDLAVSGSLPPPAGDLWQWSLHLGGSLERVRLDGRSEGYLDAGFEGEVAVLDPDIPVRLQLSSPRFLVHPQLPPTLALNSLQLSVRGSLAGGWRIQGEATLPGTAGPVSARFSTLADTEQARDVRLQLLAPEGEEGEVTVTGAVHWSPSLSADLELLLEAFPWHTLVPGMDVPPVDLQQLSAQLQWQDNRYQGQFQARTLGPPGEADISATLAGDMEAVTVSGLTLRTGAGSLTGTGQLEFATALQWQAELMLQGFNPGYWLPALEASLDGAVRTRGSLPPDQPPRIAADWNLNGLWQGQAAAASGSLMAEQGQWQLSDLRLAVGDNRLTGAGRLGEQLQAQLALSLNRPGQLLPGLRGTLVASLDLKGRLEAPEIRLDARGRNLAWQDQAAVTLLELEGRLARGRQAQVALQARELDIAGTAWQSLVVTADGTPESHRLQLDLQHADGRLALALAGAFAEGWQNWRGQWLQGDIQLPAQGQHWSLQAPADLVWERSLTVGEHCWAWQLSRVCAGAQRLWPQPDVAYRIERFPVQALASLLPETLKWQAEISGHIRFTRSSEGPRGEVVLDADAGSFRVLVDGDWQTLTYRTLSVGLDIQPDRAGVTVAFAGDSLGRFRIEGEVDPRRPGYPLKGKFQLENVELALTGLYSGLSGVTGEIRGQGQISGPLLRPAIRGQIELVEGHIRDPALPVSLENIHLTLVLSGYKGTLQGQIGTDPARQLAVQGSLDWSGVPRGQVSVRGGPLDFLLEPYARLELVPDLTLAFAGKALTVTGEVSVPRGEIEVRGLPEQAVQVSEDEVIVGSGQGPAAAPVSVAMAVTVNVGEEQVSFSAFGITGDLQGSLRIGNDLDTRGSLQLNNGSYEAWGQELELRTARLLFVGNLTQPYLQVEAIRKVDNVVAGLRMSGPVQAPVTEVFSEPDMAESEALSWLVLGRSSQTRGEQGQVARAALSLGLIQANRITGAIGEELGIRQLILEAEETGGQTSVVASGYLSDELSIRYGVGVFEPVVTIALRYDLGRYLYLEAASGLAASLDLFYSRDF